MNWNVVNPSKLREIDLFAELSDEALKELAAIMHIERFKRGELIFGDGEPGRAMYLIAEGEVRISKQIEGLGEEALAILKPGSYFGEMGMLDGEPTSAEAWANRTCVLHAIKRDALLALMAKDRAMSVELLWSFVHTLSDRLRETNSKVTFLATAGRF
ncbi:MAG: cyclic nucleotide-binding domain-containing protein [Myxococcota bacterium]